MADELCGAVGGWEFKAYVLGALFYRFISENFTEYINKLHHDAGITDLTLTNKQNNLSEK